MSAHIIMVQQVKKRRNHILSMRVSDNEWGVIQDCALQRGARVSEVMRDALRMYMQRMDNTHGKEI